MGLQHVVRTTPKTSLVKLTLTVVEMQQLPDIEKTDSKKQSFFLKWTIYFIRRKVCVNFRTDIENLKIVVYRYRNNLYFEDNEAEPKLTDYQLLLTKQVYLLSYIDIFHKQFILLDETTVHN